MGIFKAPHSKTVSQAQDWSRVPGTVRQQHYPLLAKYYCKIYSINLEISPGSSGVPWRLGGLKQVECHLWLKPALLLTNSHTVVRLPPWLVFLGVKLYRWIHTPPKGQPTPCTFTRIVQLREACWIGIIYLVRSRRRGEEDQWRAGT